MLGGQTGVQFCAVLFCFLFFIFNLKSISQTVKPDASNSKILGFITGKAWTWQNENESSTAFFFLIYIYI